MDAYRLTFTPTPSIGEQYGIAAMTQVIRDKRDRVSIIRAYESVFLDIVGQALDISQGLPANLLHPVHSDMPSYAYPGEEFSVFDFDGRYLGTIAWTEED